MSTIINQLFENYELEGVSMPYTMEDFQKDSMKNHLDLLSSEEVLQRFSADEVLQKFSSNERLKGLSLEEIQAYLKQIEKPSKP